MGYTGQTSPIHGGPDSQLSKLKGSAASMSWCQIPQYTFRGLVEKKRDLDKIRQVADMYILRIYEVKLNESIIIANVH